MKKIAILLLSLTLLAACGQKYDIIDTEVEANKINNEQLKEDDNISKVYFDLNKSLLKQEGKNTLDAVAKKLKSQEDVKIVIEGHCDERGTREYNLALGQRRAESVKKYLVEKGIKAGSIKTISYGKEQPEFIGSGEEVWSKNRRGVIIVK